MGKLIAIRNFSGQKGMVLRGDKIEVPEPYFSEYIEHAWTLFEEAKNSMFLKRNRFLEILSDLLQSNELLPKNNKIAWPHAILFLTPENICKAYIKWKENSSPKASEPEDITS